MLRMLVGIVMILLVFRVIPESLLKSETASSIAGSIFESYLEYITTPTGVRKYSTLGSVASFDDDARYQMARVGLKYSIMDMEVGRSVFSDVIMYRVEHGLIYAKYRDGYGILNMEDDLVISSPGLSDLSDEEQEVFNNIEDMKVLTDSYGRNYFIINFR